MKNWKVYTIYAEDSNDVYKLTVPAPSKKEAELYVANSGCEIIKIKEFDEFDMSIDINYLGNAMRREGFGDAEVDVVCRTLQMVGLDER